MAWLVHAGAETGATEESPMKSRRTKKPVVVTESKSAPAGREPAVLHEQGGERTAAWRSFTTIDDDWTRAERQRGRLKDAIFPHWQKPEAVEGTRPQKTGAVAQSKYEPTDHERAVLAKQAERLKDQVRVPRLKFVEGRGGGWLAFDHPDNFIAFALLKEAIGTADDQFANGVLHYLCAVLPVDENSACEFPRADDLNHAISIIAAGKAVDEIHAQIFADLAVCRITRERLLRNLSGPIRFDLSPELRSALYYYRYNPKDQTDREVKIDSRPVLEFSLRYATKLMTMEIELIAAADRHRASVESSKKVQQLSAVMPVEAGLGDIKVVTPNTTPKKANAGRAHRLNGSAVPRLPQKTDSTTPANGNSHTPT
jgi:hypothetical protein